MRRLAGALLLAGCAAVEEAPRPAPAVSDTDIRQHKLALEKGCRDAGVRRRDPAAKIDGYCACVSETFDRSLSRREWEEAIVHARNGRSREAAQVLAPYLARLERCRSLIAS